MTNDHEGEPVPFVENKCSVELIMAIRKRRRELAAERQKTYDQIEKDIWG